MIRSILHINIPSFYCSIETAIHSSLRDSPFVIAGQAGLRSIIADSSVRAMKEGVFKGQTIEHARRICRDIIVLPPRYPLYASVQSKLISQALAFSSLVESAGPGHVFVDVTGSEKLLGNGMNIAESLHKKIAGTLGISGVIGVSSNKMVSKIATRVITDSCICSIVNGCESDFLQPLPLSIIPGIDTRTLACLELCNVKKVSDVTAVEAEKLAYALGPSAFSLHRMCTGIDESDVLAHNEPAPFLHKHIEFGIFTNDISVLTARLFEACSEVGIALRKRCLAPEVIELCCIYADSTCCKKKATVASPRNTDMMLYRSVIGLFHRTVEKRIRLKTMDVFFRNLTFPYGHTDLFDSMRDEDLQRAMDAVRHKFGKNSIGFCNVPSVRVL